MFLKSIYKYPVLVAGILMMSIFISQLSKQGKNFWSREKLVPSSCKAVLVMLERRIPKNWKASCIGDGYNFLDVQIDTDIAAENDLVLKKAMYRDLANHMTFISKNSPNDNLERVDEIKVSFEHKKFLIKAYVKGKDLAKLSTLNHTDFIMNHLSKTVKIQEIIK